MATAVETFAQIHEHGANVADDSLKVIPENFPPGQYIPQGDINIVRLPALPAGVIQGAAVAQLAPGTTRGSRHCIKAEDMNHCEFYALKEPSSLQGPIIVFREPTTIEHPEHGDQLWPACIVAITYQRRYADEIKRIQD